MPRAPQGVAGTQGVSGALRYLGTPVPELPPGVEYSVDPIVNRNVTGAGRIAKVG
jgi:hypothetical protein